MAKRITNSSTCKELGLSLGLDGNAIDSILYNHRNEEIASAANTMLSKWLLRYQDRKIACGDLITALRKCELQGLIPEVFAEEYRAFQTPEMSPSTEPVPETSEADPGISITELDDFI